MKQWITSLIAAGVLALVAMSTSAYAWGSDPMTCSSKDTSDTLRDLIQMQIIAPFVEAQRKAGDLGIAQVTAAQQQIAQMEALSQSPNSRPGTGAMLGSMMGLQLAAQCTERYPNDLTAQTQCVNRAGDMLKNPEGAIAKIKAIVAKIDTDPILFEVRDIITTDKTDYKVTCKATIHWSGGDGWEDFPTNDATFTFMVEKTDAGELYVTEHGLGQSLK